MGILMCCLLGLCMFVDVLAAQIWVLVVCWLSLSWSAVLWLWQAALLVVCIEVLLSVDGSVTSVCTYVLCWSYRCVTQCVCAALQVWLSDLKWDVSGP